jgi:hypothetical protein
VQRFLKKFINVIFDFEVVLKPMEEWHIEEKWVNKIEPQQLKKLW